LAAFFNYFLRKGLLLLVCYKKKEHFDTTIWCLKKFHKGLLGCFSSSVHRITSKNLSLGPINIVEGNEAFR
jgi:hypothetical protein